MKNTIILFLTLASALAIPRQKIKSRTLVVPAGQPEGRLSRAQDAAEGEFSYQIILIIRDHNSTFFSCGGSLLNNKWVLTAAHCTIIASEVKVLVGATGRTTANVIHVVTGENIINHESYDPNTVENDISLIKIPFTDYSHNIQPVELPAKTSTYSDYSGKSVIASGWGRNAACKLQWARLYVIPNSVCFQNFDIYSSNLCTSTIGGVNICDGDSGGPLVLQSSKTQIGIISFGDNDCTSTKPGVYTRVTSYLEWIENHTNDSS